VHALRCSAIKATGTLGNPSLGVGQFRLQRIAILNGITLEVKSALILPKVRKFWAKAEGYSVPETAESY
jgi:hypothetical protein